MSLNLFWLQCGACSGDSMSLLNMDSPDIAGLQGLLDAKILWHPSLSNGSVTEFRDLIQGMLSGSVRLDVLIVEGAIVRGPGGTGMYDTLDGKPKKDLVAGLARNAGIVVAVGTCAAFGGIGSDGDVEATGLQFHKTRPGGFLGTGYRSGAGLPVVNLPGCPCHCDVVVGSLAALASGAKVELNEWNAPMDYYGMLVHQGCVRNEYHEYRVEEENFGEKGCLFFHRGCRGPLAYGPCNKLLWNGRRSSKTRVGVPCVGCTQPDFPQSFRFFETRAIAGIPIELPAGVDRAHYLAYKGMAAAAAPTRLRDRQTRV